MVSLNSFTPAAILKRAGVFDAVPNALARTNGFLTLSRAMALREPAPVAPCAADVIDVAGAAKLLRYRSKGTPLDKAPILLCPSLINRLYVLDLKEGISVVDVLLQAGHPVYGIDWGEPGEAEHGVTFEQYVVERLQGFLASSCADARVEKITLLGHCLGGTMAATLAAVDDSKIQSLVLLTAPLTFHDDGMLSAWTRAPFFNPRDVTAVVGHVPGWVTQPAFQILKPMGQPAKLLRLWQNLGNPTFLDFFRCLETWINDNVSIPDGFFHDLVEQLYQRDALHEGRLRFQKGEVVLENIEVPVLCIAAREDHIVPHASATAPIEKFASATKQVEVLDGGHIGVVVGGLARRKLWPLLLAWLEKEGVAANAQRPKTATTKTPSA